LFFNVSAPAHRKKVSKYAVSARLIFNKNSTIFMNGKKLYTSGSGPIDVLNVWFRSVRHPVFLKNRRTDVGRVLTLRRYWRLIPVRFTIWGYKKSRKPPAIEKKNENKRTFLLCSTKKTNIDTEFCIDVCWSSFREGYFYFFLVIRGKFGVFSPI